MQQKSMYVIIAVLMALVVALAGSLVAIVEEGKPTVVLKAGAVTFTGTLTLALGVMLCLGVVGS
ncbi:hypothetical protein ACIA8M_23800 [Streptomyces anulatus]